MSATAPHVDDLAAELRAGLDRIAATLAQLSRQARCLAHLVARRDLVADIQAEIRPVADKLTEVYGRVH